MLQLENVTSRISVSMYVWYYAQHEEILSNLLDIRYAVDMLTSTEIRPILRSQDVSDCTVGIPEKDHVFSCQSYVCYTTMNIQ